MLVHVQKTALARIQLAHSTVTVILASHWMETLAQMMMSVPTVIHVIFSKVTLQFATTWSEALIALARPVFFKTKMSSRVPILMSVHKRKFAETIRFAITLTAVLYVLARAGFSRMQEISY